MAGDVGRSAWLLPGPGRSPALPTLPPKVRALKGRDGSYGFLSGLHCSAVGWRSAAGGLQKPWLSPGLSLTALERNRGTSLLLGRGGGPSFLFVLY